MIPSVLFWRRTDVPGLERLVLAVTADGVTARSTVLCAEAGGFRLEHRWRLDAHWRAHSAEIERWGVAGHGILRLERAGTGWKVDGAIRPDLDGTAEPDLSATPFCNTLAIRRLADGSGATLDLDVAFVDAAALTVTRSRQRYMRKGPRRVRYVDLGLSHGFEADLVTDADGLVVDYEHLFARVTPED